MTLNYSLHSASNYFVEDILEVVARNRGIKDINKIKNPSINDVIHYSKLVNMDKMVKVFDAYIQTGEIIHVVTITDEDCDGFTSNASLVQYLEKNFPNIRVQAIFHEKKEHGLTDDIMKKINKLENIDMLIVADAGSNDYENHEELYKKGVPVLILDHHTAPHLSEYAVVVNNQLSPKYDNKQLSGVGVVYKFLQALDDYYGFSDADTYLDLSAIGNIGDSMDIGNNPETRYYVYDGIKKIQNSFLKEMIYKHIGKWDKISPHTLSFNLIPKINAMIRVGKQEEKEKMFYAMIGREEEYYNSRTKKTENLVETATRLATNAHARQNKLKKKWISIIKEKIEAQNLNSRPVLVITFEKSEKFDRSLTGVIASGLTNIYRKPVIIMTHNEEKKNYKGSMRGYEDFTSDFQHYLEELLVFDWVQGHPNAAGVQISEENLRVFEQLQDKMKEQFTLDVNSGENEIKVDFIISAKNMRGQIVDEVSKYEKYWGKGIEAPVFAIEGLEIDMNDVKVSSGGMIKLSIAGTDYTMFSASEDWIELAETNQVVTFDAIGTMGINEFLGKSTRQFIMDNYVIKSVEESKKKKVLFEF